MKKNCPIWTLGRKELAVTGNCTRCDDDDIFIFRYDKLAHRLLGKRPVRDAL